MAKPKPKMAEVIPVKCTKCGSEKIKREEFSMHGKLGFMGPEMSIFAGTAVIRSSSSRVQSGFVRKCLSGYWHLMSSPR